MKRAADARTIRVALAGNPNVGKSSLFNALTGLHRHTGNWSGKTVDIRAGYLRRSGKSMEFVDLPGTYSLRGSSPEERVAAEYIASDAADCIVVVCDATALERSLILAVQIVQRAPRVLLCVNLMDEAQRMGISVDAARLAERLGVSVVLTSATRRRGLDALQAAIRSCVRSPQRERKSFSCPLSEAQSIACECVRQDVRGSETRLAWEKMLVSRRHGVPIALTGLFLILWLSIRGANYPSAWLQSVFDRGYDLLSLFALPPWLRGLLLDGMYATAARVLAVMLPPMAIFFPLFTLLEDIGYLPRMAFLLDGKMHRCGGCGKQALTLCMGLGCNAVGVMGCRIIDSPRQRLAAVVTNAMVPCNGRFATLIVLGTLLCGESYAALAVAAAITLGFLGAMLTTRLLSRTALRRHDSFFLLELPPLRRPRIGSIMLRSLLDRTLKIALRALSVAAPAGAVLWLLEQSGACVAICAFLQPVGTFFGINGALLLAFLLSFPANELLLPLLATIGGSAALPWPCALCAMILTVFHWPCSTTLLTVYRETRSRKATCAAFFLPTVIGLTICALLNALLCLLL